MKKVERRRLRELRKIDKLDELTHAETIEFIGLLQKDTEDCFKIIGVCMAINVLCFITSVVVRLLK